MEKSIIAQNHGSLCHCITNPNTFKLLSLTRSLMFLLPNHFCCLSIALLVGLYYLRQYCQTRSPQSLAEKGYCFANVGSNVSLYTDLKSTVCLGTILHRVCKSNLPAVFSCSSPLVILISRAILLIDFRLFSWGLFLFVLFSIYGVRPNLASHYSIHPLRKSYNHFAVGCFFFFFLPFANRHEQITGRKDKPLWKEWIFGTKKIRKMYQGSRGGDSDYKEKICPQMPLGKSQISVYKL